MTDINPSQRRALRADAHHLHPVVSISQNGLSATVIKEIDRALAAHELIKIKLYGIERQDRDSLMGEICSQLNCSPVQQIGNILVIWREKPEDKTPAQSVGRRAKPLTKKQAAAATEPRRRAALTEGNPRGTRRGGTPAEPASPRTAKRRSP
jgi:putative YhbY family RNA-binding protein